MSFLKENLNNKPTPSELWLTAKQAQIHEWDYHYKELRVIEDPMEKILREFGLKMDTAEAAINREQLWTRCWPRVRELKHLFLDNLGYRLPCLI